MQTYELLRSYLPDRTVGKLGKFCTLERPWLNNQQKISCIPEGEYRVLRDRAGRYQCFRIDLVPGRTNIEFHAGNYPSNSEGCILVGSAFNEKYDLVGSGVAVKKMTETFPEQFTLIIRSYDPMTDGPR